MKFRIFFHSFLLQAIGSVWCCARWRWRKTSLHSRNAPRSKKLANGLTVIICERPEAPVFSFFTMWMLARCKIHEENGNWRNMFEHMAFKEKTRLAHATMPARRLRSQKSRLRMPPTSPSVTNGSTAMTRS